MRKPVSIIVLCIVSVFCASAQENSHNVRVGISLPFSTDEKVGNTNSLDFYCGALIAIKELGDSGIDINLNCVDSDNSFAFPDNANFIIGPIKRDALVNMLDAVDSSTYVVSPLDHRADPLVEIHPNFIQAAPSSALQYKEACSWSTADTFLPKHYILITTNDEPQQRADAMSGLMAVGQTYSEFKCSVSDDIEGLDMAFLEGFENIVLVAIANEAILNNAIRNLSKFSRLFQMQVYCNNKIRSYETIPVENIHKVSARCLCPYFIDYSDRRTLDFIHRYRALYNREPNQFAFQGYDITYFMISTFARYGKDWREIVTRLDSASMLQASFKFRENGKPGLINEAVRKVEYCTDYRVVSVAE